MGLDLFHFKMIPHPGAALKKHTHTILLRNIPSGLATEYGLDSRCYGIPVMEIQHTVRIYQDIPALETAARSGQLRPHEKEGVSWLVGSVESCGEEIQRIEQALGLVPAGVHRMKMNDYSGSVPAEIGASVWWSRTVTYMGSYLELAGYQRKGVLEEFKDDYEEGVYYPQYSRFLALPNYMDFDSEDEDDRWRFENIEQNFISGYEHGRSILLYLN